MKFDLSKFTRADLEKEYSDLWSEWNVFKCLLLCVKEHSRNLPVPIQKELSTLVVSQQPIIKKEVALRNLHQAYYEYVWVHELGEQLPVDFKQLPHQCDLESFKSEVEETALMVKVTQGY